jgi:orotidine-5'-phosphate decarboxylase
MLNNLIKEKKSFLCVGIDPLPKLIGNQTPINFCLKIINSTIDYAVAYKLNAAFFEYCGLDTGIIAEYAKRRGAYVIIDGKRGDIGNSSEAYAKACFENMDADAVTVSPYMGYDSVQPFLEYENKTTIILGLTSNEGANDFQMLKLENGKRLYEHVIETSLTWKRKSDLMFVVGATRINELEVIRKICPDNFLLIPGIGTQGGSLQEVIDKGMNDNVGLLVNCSRSIIYSDNPAKAALDIQKQMHGFL